MQDPFRTIEWKSDHIRLLDQTLLPQREEYIQIRTVEEMCDAIRRLAVRGAPAIGVAAAMGIALGMLEAPDGNRESFAGHFDNVCRQIGSTRPTAVNLFWAIARMKEVFYSGKHTGPNGTQAAARGRGGTHGTGGPGAV